MKSYHLKYFSFRYTWVLSLWIIHYCFQVWLFLFFASLKLCFFLVNNRECKSVLMQRDMKNIYIRILFTEHNVFFLLFFLISIKDLIKMLYIYWNNQKSLWVLTPVTIVNISIKTVSWLWRNRLYEVIKNTWAINEGTRARTQEPRSFNY